MNTLKIAYIGNTALEQCMLALEAYGLSPEMGHKEVGGKFCRLINCNIIRYQCIRHLFL